ncbi:MAG: hypothetical protein ACUVQF_00920 [Fervidobacterium sp.]|uniref:hypothetical protein n=1 Tax=Fervidobacterium sp. TaxID=1871331 RepID=UPI00404A8A13
MSDVDIDKINNTIKELEKEAENIKKISKIISDIERLDKEIKITKDMYSQALDNLNEIGKQLNKLVNKNYELLNEIRLEIAEIKSVINNCLKIGEHKVRNSQ